MKIERGPVADRQRSTLTLPVISRTDPAFSKKLTRLIKETGFGAVSGYHGFRYIFETADQCASDFFDLLLAEKLECERDEFDRQVGYTPFRKEGHPDAFVQINGEKVQVSDDKECFNVMAERSVDESLPSGAYHNVYCNKIPYFRERLMPAFYSFQSINIDILEQLAIGLRLPPGALTDDVSESNSLTRFLRYPPVSSNVKGYRGFPHKDCNKITSLYAPKGILKIEGNDGTVYETHTEPGVLVFNIGITLAEDLAYNYDKELHETIHGVVMMPGFNALRQSIAGFTHGGRDRVIGPNGRTVLQTVEQILKSIGVAKSKL